MRLASSFPPVASVAAAPRLADAVRSAIVLAGYDARRTRQDFRTYPAQALALASAIAAAFPPTDVAFPGNAGLQRHAPHAFHATATAGSCRRHPLPAALPPVVARVMAPVLPAWAQT